MRFSSRNLSRTLTGVVSVLALAPLLYFAACSSSDDSGGGGSPPPSNNTPPPGASNQFAYVTSAGTSETQAYSVDGSGNLTPIGSKINTG